MTTIPTHTSARILLLNADKKLLLIRAEDPSTRLPGEEYTGPFWFTPGGKIEEGESPYEAAKREIWEETGLDPNKIQWGPIVWKGRFDLVLSGTLTQLEQVFIVAKTTETKVLTLDNLTKEESTVIKDVRWFSLEDITQSAEPIYPLSLRDHLPSILEDRYPKIVKEISLA